MVCLLLLVPTNSSQLDSFLHLCIDSLGWKFKAIPSPSRSRLKLEELGFLAPILTASSFTSWRLGELEKPSLEDVGDTPLKEDDSAAGMLRGEETAASWTLPRLSELEQLEARDTFSGEHEALRLLAMGKTLSHGTSPLS